MIELRYLFPEVVLLFKSPLVETRVCSLAVALHLLAVIDHIIEIVVRVILILSFERFARGSLNRLITVVRVVSKREILL
jgi:hypothetical protein